ncbi:MAG: glycosyltransferase family 1 protein [bacterium]
MKIGIDARMYGNRQTGIGNYIKHLIKYLGQLDQANEYVIFLMEPMYSEFICPNSRFSKVLVKSRWYSWQEQLILPWQLYKQKLDLIHFPHFNSPLFYRGRSVCTIHDITPYFFPGHKMTSIIRRLGFRLVFGNTVRHAQKVFAVSEHTKKDIIKYFKIKEEKIIVTYEGVEDHFRIINDEQKINELKEKYHITKPFIFYVGVWRNHKNLVSLIKAFDLLLRKYNLNYQLVLGGKEDPYYPEIRQTWESLGLQHDIIRPSFIQEEDLPYFYNAADLFVIPSFYEGFGLIGLEAMACGTPVTASDITSLPEVLGSAARYFDPQDPESMARVMRGVLTNENERAEMKKQGLEQIKKYSWLRCAEQTLAVYKEIGLKYKPLI